MRIKRRSSKPKHWIWEYVPKDLPEYMYSAWFSCLGWAISEPQVTEAFRIDTGLTYRAPRNPIERMIDKASGRELEICKSFLVWFNEHIWGKL